MQRTEIETLRDEIDKIDEEMNVSGYLRLRILRKKVQYLHEQYLYCRYS